MEKRKASYPLSKVQAVLGEVDTLAITTTALSGASSLGFDRPAICEAIRSLKTSMFYKSMTTVADHTLWQDVYHLPWEDGAALYIKVQADAVTEFKLVSFKEK